MKSSRLLWGLLCLFLGARVSLLSATPVEIEDMIRQRYASLNPSKKNEITEELSQAPLSLIPNETLDELPEIGHPGTLPTSTFLDKVKAHPFVTASALLGGGVLIYYLYKKKMVTSDQGPAFE